MLKSLHAIRKTGDETFTGGDGPLGFTVLDFWKWYSSDLVSNSMRGCIAEFMVARALGLDRGVRNEWDAYDLRTAPGFRIEVKSAAYLQSWAQRVESPISFDIRETVAWDANSNARAPESERRRQAHLYVFALLEHHTKETLNPLDVSQWAFFLLEASVLNQHVKKLRSISLKRLQALEARRCSYADLRPLISDVEARYCLKARRTGHPDSEMTLDDYWLLPEPAQSETSLFHDGNWTRPNRFISDGSDITVEKSAPKTS
jgi:hypothetical protein